MAHLPRFHRRKRDAASPALEIPGKASPTPRDPTGNSILGGPHKRSLQKLSPFRVFHRSSGKRARDSPPASLPHSPAPAPVTAGDGSDGRPVSPLSLKTDPSVDEGRNPANPPKMPAFLNQTYQEIQNKFEELTWREHERIAQSIANPSPDFRWALVSGPHLKVLDRYLNVQPWHNNRVKLQVPHGHVDYINASPIVLMPSRHRRTAAGRPREPDRYIAMQGPKRASMDHVWRMVVEQLESPGVIVMLTETHEGRLEKCFPYFPRSPDDPPIVVNERDEFGDGFRATVRCEALEDTPAGDAIELRKLVIRVHARTRPGTKIEGTAVPEPSSEGEAVAAAAAADDDDGGGLDDGDRNADLDVKMDVSGSGAASSASQSIRTDISPEPQLHGDNIATGHPLQHGKDGGEGADGEQQRSEEEEERIVYHFLYKNWPDFGAPSLDDLESFFTLMRLSRERNAHPGNPRIVHCSAGVGRSGTFIALEHLIRELEDGTLERFDGGGGGGGGDDGDDGTRAWSFSAEKTGRGGQGDGDGAGEEGGESEEGLQGSNQRGRCGQTPSSFGPSCHTGTGGAGRGGGSGGDNDSAAPKLTGPWEEKDEKDEKEEGVKEEVEDLIFETVDQLRQQRRTMVQAPSQYLFIYQVLRKLWVDKYGEPEPQQQQHQHQQPPPEEQPRQQQSLLSQLQQRLPGEHRRAEAAGGGGGSGGGGGGDRPSDERAPKRLEMDPSAGRG